jgi:hypothetical protein
MCLGFAECHRHAVHRRELAEKDQTFPLNEAFSDLAKKWDFLAARPLMRGKALSFCLQLSMFISEAFLS